MKTNSRQNGEADDAEMFRLARAHDTACASLRAWLTTRDTLTRDEQVAILGLIDVSLGFQLLTVRQIIRQYTGEPVAMDQFRSAVESAMLRACALEVQLAGVSFVSQLEHYSQPIQS